MNYLQSEDECMCKYNLNIYIQTIGSCCLYVFCYYHILSYCLGSIFYQYMVVFLFNTVICVFLLLGLRILIV